VGSVPPERAGAASAISETGAELGGAMGVALLGSLGTVIYRLKMQPVDFDGVPQTAVDASRSTLASAVETASTMGLTDAAWLAVARSSFSLGFAGSCLFATA